MATEEGPSDTEAERASMYVPPIKKGWMTKQGRKGIVKTWRKRYFVLDAGVIKYYQQQLDDPPYGEGLKGEMLLSNTEIISENRKYNDKQIMLVSFSGDHNMLMQAEDAKSADSWVRWIKEHIRYADGDNEFAVADPLKAEKRRFKARSLMLEKAADADTAEFDRPSGTSESTESRSRSRSRSRSTKKVVVEEDMCELQPYITELFGSAVTVATNFANDAEQRKQNIAHITESVQLALTAGIASITDVFGASTSASTAGDGDDGGDVVAEGGFQLGSHGEGWLLTLIVLFTSIIFSLHQRLLQYINMLIHLSAIVYILCGLLMIVDAVVQLRSSFSFLPEPNADNNLVITGSYRLVRHPMYGGAILVTVGLAIASHQLYKLVLALAFALIMDRVAHQEEALLLQDYPLAYRKFIGSRRKFVPFLF